MTHAEEPEKNTPKTDRPEQIMNDEQNNTELSKQKPKPPDQAQIMPDNQVPRPDNQEPKPDEQEPKSLDQAQAKP